MLITSISVLNFNHVMNTQLHFLIADVNECSSAPCGQHAQCTALIAQFICTCNDGYTGMFCETGITSNNAGTSEVNCMTY